MKLAGPPLELNADFQYALDRMEKEQANLFITGRAGTGKSTLLQLFRRTTHKRVVVLAPTGVAALNVQGQTIHSFFGFPPRTFDTTDIKKRRFRKLYENLDCLVIDEVSMVRADMLDHIDHFLRINREDPRPFGGVQMLFFGDLFQLPPVVRGEVDKKLFSQYYDSPYFFSAHIFQEGFVLEGIELRKVYRQKNGHFLNLLDAIRLNRIEREDLAELNQRYRPDFTAQAAFITLSARNHRVNTINEQELDRIPFPARIYTARTTGNFPVNLYPTDVALRLKIQAQVMFIRNDPDKAYVNGTIGKIVKLEDDTVTVEVEENGTSRQIKTGMLEWEMNKYQIDPDRPDKISTQTLGTFRQLPLRLAWAVTIHKAQGKTFDKVIIDLGRGAFEHGQTYVALSRCTSLEGIVLKEAIRQKDILTDERVVEYYEQTFL